jgi:hypothetical protein
MASLAGKEGALEFEGQVGAAPDPAGRHAGPAEQIGPSWLLILRRLPAVGLRGGLGFHAAGRFDHLLRLRPHLDHTTPRII